MPRRWWWQRNPAGVWTSARSAPFTNHMIELRNSGTAILLISSSLDEIFELSDRIAVIFEGKITALFDPKQVTREEIGLYMSGAKKEEMVQWERS